MPILNLDAGEHDDEPEELWALADVLAVACGGHAGDSRSMGRIAAFCAARGRTRIGAHPSYPDREGFGRRRVTIDHATLARSLHEQVAELDAIAHAHGVSIGWVKPHGALYHDAAGDRALADLVVAAAGNAAIIGPPHGALRDAAQAHGLVYLREGFADRGVRADGSLVPRGEPGALITDPVAAAARARELGSQVDTICVHADTPDSLAIARAVREAIDQRSLKAVPVPDWVALGDRAIRFARPATSARVIVREVRAWPGVVDVVVARHDVAAYFDAEPSVNPAWIAALAHAPPSDEPVREIDLHVRYDGADLADVARATGLAIADVIERHSAVTYIVDTMGFAPGFAYLAGLDPKLVVPRRANPRTKVPAGSLAIADDYTAVYPFDSPGGWHLIGSVIGVRMFDSNGSLLHLGDRVRFVP